METTATPGLHPRGLSSGEAFAYLGVSRREFKENWKPHLPFIKSGTRVLYDVMDLDLLFEAKKQPSSELFASRIDNAKLRQSSNQTGSITPAVLDLMTRCLEASRRTRAVPSKSSSQGWRS